MEIFYSRNISNIWTISSNISNISKLPSNISSISKISSNISNIYISFWIARNPIIFKKSQQIQHYHFRVKSNGSQHRTFYKKRMRIWGSSRETRDPSRRTRYSVIFGGWCVLSARKCGGRGTIVRASGMLLLSKRAEAGIVAYTIRLANNCSMNRRFRYVIKLFAHEILVGIEFIFG